MEIRKTFFSRALVVEFPGGDDRVTFRPRSRANAAVMILLIFPLLAYPLFLRTFIPPSTSPMGSIALGFVTGLKGMVGIAGCYFVGSAVIELARYWMLILDPGDRTLTISCRTPFSKSTQTYSFEEIEGIVYGRPQASLHWKVQIAIKNGPIIPLGEGPQAAAVALATRLQVLTGGGIFQR